MRHAVELDERFWLLGRVRLDGRDGLFAVLSASESRRTIGRELRRPFAHRFLLCPRERSTPNSVLRRDQLASGQCFLGARER